MRESALLLLLLLGACAGDIPAAGTVIHDFRERSLPLRCEPLSLDGGLALTELRGVSDTSWVVLDEAQGIVRVLDDRLRPLWEVRMERDGPLGLPRPVGVAAAGDTVLYVLDRQRILLAVLDPRTGTGRTVPLEFLPGGVTALPDGGAAVSAMPIGGRPRELLFLLEGDTLRPLDVPQRPYPDLTVNGVGNMLLAEADAAGAIVAIHQFMAPRAFRIRPDRAVERLEPPVPDGTAGKRDYVPIPPITEENMPFVYLGAAALSLDRSTGEVYVLTQTGRREGDRSERAIMRLDPSLEYLESYLLDLSINAGHMVYLPRRRAFILGDDLDRLFLCPAPGSARAPAE